MDTNLPDTNLPDRGVDLAAKAAKLNFISEAMKNGFDISVKEQRYLCSFKCNHCGTQKIEEVFPNTEMHDNIVSVQCSLPIYCEECRKE